MWVLLGVYLVCLLFHGSGFRFWVDGVLDVGTQFLPALVCWLCLKEARGRRREVAWLALGMTAFAAGNTVLVVALAQDRTLPVPSTADVGYLGFYPLVLTAVALAVRPERPSNEEPSGSTVCWADRRSGGDRPRPRPGLPERQRRGPVRGRLVGLPLLRSRAGRDAGGGGRNAPATGRPLDRS